MTRSLTFTIPGEVDTQILVVENADGTLTFTVAVDENSQQADLRGLFFNLGDDSLLEGLTVAGADVTDSQFDANSVKDLGNGANMKGEHTKKGNGFDAGVKFGTPGIGKDDIDTTSFTLMSSDGPLTLDLLTHMRFGVRLTSVGPEGDRDDSLKITGHAPAAPDALDDCLQTDEDTSAGMNILSNDMDADGDALTVTAIEGGAVGAAFSVDFGGGMIGELTVNADGSTIFDPNGQFETLTTEDTVTKTLTYWISDGDGGADCAEVTIKVDGVNDAPVANADEFFIEAGDTTLFDVAANDTDVDGDVDPTSLQFFGSIGAASESGGELSYTASNIGGDTTDDSFNDAFTYTIDDNEGLSSNPGSITAKVIDPLVETATDVSNAANGQSISLTLSTEDRTYNTTSLADVDIQIGALVQPNVNVAFAVDESGSVGVSQFNQEVAAVQGAINALRTQFSGSGTDVEVQLIEFASGAGSQTYGLYDSALNDITSGTPYDDYSGGATNYDAALDQAVNFFTGQGGDENFLIFISDGVPYPSSNANVGDEMAVLNGLNVSSSAYGFGGATEAGLDLVDNTGGGETLNNAGELASALLASPIFPADLIEFSLTVNGVEVADETNLDGNDDLDTVLLGLDNTLAATNDVVATARFDTNNDGFWDEERVASTVIEGTDGTDISFA